MPTTFVAIDVETTGLDPHRDAITEVAAITFDRDQVHDEFQSLINPQRAIPAHITELTGITDSMVQDAPTISAIRSTLKGFLGDHILVGHNIGFDLGFLKASFIGSGSHRLDTVTLASILLPNAGKYGLEALTAFLELPLPGGKQAHRALADSKATVNLFLTLLEYAKQLGLPALTEIVQMGNQIGWNQTPFFQEALNELAINAFEDGRSSRPPAKLFNPPAVEGSALTPDDDNVYEIDSELIAGMLQPGGNFDQSFPDFEYRPQQEAMVYAVCEAFNRGESVMIEAGTGTGKSIGYLLPAAFWSERNQRHVVVSTNTINLQEQLIHKDIPQLQQLLGSPLRAAILKGKSNYICTRLFQQLRRRGVSSADEMALFARILSWLPHTHFGDKSEINLRTPGEQSAWNRLNGDNDGCTREICAQNRCPLHLARQRAKKAHILIVNHALLLADVAAGNQILPEHRELIIDEAHHLESAVTDALSFRADKRSLENSLDEIIKPRAGQLSVILSTVQSSAPVEIGQQFDSYVEQIRGEAVLAKAALEDFFTAIEWFLKDQIKGTTSFARQLRLTNAIRAQPHYSDIEISWENFGHPLFRVSDGLIKLSDRFADIHDAFTIEDGDDLKLELGTLGKEIAETAAYINAIISDPDKGWIYWLEQLRDRISLHAAPLHVGPLVDENIFQKNESVILASATLRTAKAGSGGEPSFEYIRDRLHGFDVGELAVGSPFDYQDSTLVYLPTDIPEPNQPGYQRAVERAILEMALTLEGRTMALFTSYAQLRASAASLAAPLAKRKIDLLTQESGVSRQQLADQFRLPGKRAVLLGTKSFWEGVDIPGEALQALIIVRIPFDVPSDPIFSARSETFDNSFFEYSIPEAVLRFRQGFGRLIRRADDEGIVLVLDKRIISKRYGQLFLDALPDCVFLRQPLGRLGELTERWFNRER